MFDGFARPWLLLLAPLIFWLLRLAFRHFHQSSWQQLLPPGLAKRLLTGQNPQSTSNRLPEPLLAGFLTLLFTLALSGPGSSIDLSALQRLHQEVVIIQRLAPPERGQVDATRLLDSSQQLLVPFLNNRQQGQTALIFYAGSAHLASPMTPDAATLRQLMSLAHPTVMPRGGDEPGEALRLASQTGLVAAGKAGKAALYWLWITDRVPTSEDLQPLLEAKPAAAELLLILTNDEISTQQEASVEGLPLTLMTPHQAAGYLEQINQATGPASQQQAAQLDAFREWGHWLLIPALLLLLWQYQGQPRPASLRFRRLFTLALPVLVTSQLLLVSPPAWAWQNTDYQAWQALRNAEPQQTLDKTTQPRLLAEAWFQLGDYTQAALAYEEAIKQPPDDTKKRLDILFNTGTAWLFAEQPEKALQYFQEVKAEDPEREDNCINYQLAQHLVSDTPLPSKENLAGLCGDAQAQEPAPQDGQTDSHDQPQAWQPQRAQCPECLPLNQEQQETLEQLQEDPWRLLRNRFRYELRERDS